MVASRTRSGRSRPRWECCPGGTARRCSRAARRRRWGVPLRGACAGVAMGLIKEGERVAVLTDILGMEDALGDMDFKVAGTARGVTSIQMDIKIEGLTIDLMREALEKA